MKYTKTEIKRICKVEGLSYKNELVKFVNKTIKGKRLLVIK